MSKRLILIRHAKSSWDDPAVSDADRPLNKRGHRASEAIGAWLMENNFIPDQQLISSSKRTRETAEMMDLPGEKSSLDTLYHANAGQMFRVLQEATGECVLMLGHNPGIAEFAGNLVASPPDHPRFSDYPTCATLVVDFPIEDWAALMPHAGQVQAFVVPKDLIG